MSWRGFWSRHENVADKMFLLSELDEIDREERITMWKNEGRAVPDATKRNGAAKPSRTRKSYVEASESDDAEESESDYGDAGSNGDDDDEDEEDAAGSTDDDEELGEAGTPFTLAEQRALAKHIASIPNYYTGDKKWNEFGEMVSVVTSQNRLTSLIGTVSIRKGHYLLGENSTVGRERVG